MMPFHRSSIIKFFYDHRQNYFELVQIEFSMLELWLRNLESQVDYSGGAMSRQSVSGFWLVVKPGHVSKDTCLEENWNMKILDDFKIKGNIYFDHTKDLGIEETMTLSLIG